MNATSVKRIEDLERRLIPKDNGVFSFARLSDEEAAGIIDFHRNACLAFQRQFGGDPAEEPGQSLTIQEKARHWLAGSSDFVVKLILEGHRSGSTGGGRWIERALTIPELEPFVDMMEKARAGRKSSTSGSNGGSPLCEQVTMA